MHGHVLKYINNSSLEIMISKYYARAKLKAYKKILGGIGGKVKRCRLNKNGGRGNLTPTIFDGIGVERKGSRRNK
jgi:hypothetical protein